MHYIYAYIYKYAYIYVILHTNISKDIWCLNLHIYIYTYIYIYISCIVPLQIMMLCENASFGQVVDLAESFPSRYSKVNSCLTGVEVAVSVRSFFCSSGPKGYWGSLRGYQDTLASLGRH